MAKLVTCEAVFRGHPDKICDQISDAIVEECTNIDENARVAIECLFKDDLLIIAGEVSLHGEKPDYKKIAREVLQSLDYNILDIRMITQISTQSKDIALGVDKNGAGDQGIMYGYATDESEEYMPIPYIYARKIAQKADQLLYHDKPIKQEKVSFFHDGKCQVTCLYDDLGIPKHITNIVISQQTTAPREFYEPCLRQELIDENLPHDLINDKTKILINPTGKFEIGGSFADCGLTGRKLACDTYGGVAHHGAGAFSGKDLTKVDRLGAYYTRYVAKNLVASRICKKCEVSVAYAIGVAEPVAVSVDTFNTGKISDNFILTAILKFFNFTPDSMRTEIGLGKIPYRKLSEFGHIGRDDLNLPWERTNKSHVLRAYFKKYKIS